MTSRDEYINAKTQMNAVELQKATEALMRQGMSKQAAEAAVKAKFTAGLLTNDPVLRNIGNEW